MTNPEDPIDSQLVDLADGVLDPADWAAWLAAHPDAARQVTAMQQAHTLLEQLRTTPNTLPAAFEARVLAQAHGEQAARELITMHVIGSGRVLHELFTLFCSFLPTPADEPLGTNP